MSAQEELQALELLLDDAADAILAAASEALEVMEAARAGSSAALDTVHGSLRAILEACSFHDLSRQRLSRLLARGDELVARTPLDPLLQGPAVSGEGLDQAAADALFSGSGAA